jgi:hypothetical protein
MKRYLVYSIVFGLLTVFSTCKKSNVPDDQQIIKEAEDRFPQLKVNADSTRDYFFAKSVNLADPSVQIKLFKTKPEEGDKKEIIILSNANGLSYPIPILGNQYKDYWNFLFDPPLKQDQSIHTTFEKEINNALERLQLNVGYDGSIIIEELLKSLINCRNLNEQDITMLKRQGGGFIESGVSEDNPDSCDKRNKLNFDTILKLMHPREHEIDENAFFDEKHSRIYQLDFKPVKQQVKNYYKIKVFRQGCFVLHYMTL